MIEIKNFFDSLNETISLMMKTGIIEEVITSKFL